MGTHPSMTIKALLAVAFLVVALTEAFDNRIDEDFLESNPESSLAQALPPRPVTIVMGSQRRAYLKRCFKSKKCKARYLCMRNKKCRRAYFAKRRAAYRKRCFKNAKCKKMYLCMRNKKCKKAYFAKRRAAHMKCMRNKKCRARYLRRRRCMRNRMCRIRYFRIIRHRKCMKS